MPALTPRFFSYRLVSVSPFIHLPAASTALCSIDNGKILKVVFGTGEDGESFPIIAEEIEVSTWSNPKNTICCHMIIFSSSSWMIQTVSTKWFYRSVLTSHYKTRRGRRNVSWVNVYGSMTKRASKVIKWQFCMSL